MPSRLLLSAKHELHPQDFAKHSPEPCITQYTIKEMNIKVYCIQGTFLNLIHQLKDYSLQQLHTNIPPPHVCQHLAIVLCPEKSLPWILHKQQSKKYVKTTSPLIYKIRSAAPMPIHALCKYLLV